MSIGVLVLASFLATLAMTTVMTGSQSIGLSRMSIPFILGSMFTDDRDRAMPIGFGVHVVNGLVLSFLYWAIFQVLAPSWWLGLIVGVCHFVVVYVVMLPIIPGFHPRMASERDGPEPTRQLEPPGFLGLNYGTQTPLVGLIAHAIYGLGLGLLGQLAG